MSAAVKGSSITLEKNYGEVKTRLKVQYDDHRWGTYIMTNGKLARIRGNDSTPARTRSNIATTPNYALRLMA